jgi:hypothetical protein
MKIDVVVGRRTGPIRQMMATIGVAVGGGTGVIRQMTKEGVATDTGDGGFHVAVRGSPLGTSGLLIIR